MDKIGIESVSNRRLSVVSCSVRAAAKGFPQLWNY